MKRRDFIQNSMLLGTSALLGNLIAPQHAGAQQKSRAQKLNPDRDLTLNGEYYRHYPVDFAEGNEGAIGFKGWGGGEEITVSADETAIIPMHIWNIDISPELPFTSEGPAGGVMDMLEWASRSAPIIKTVIPPVLAAARQAGIPVIHVASGESYAKKYPGYSRALRLAGSEPAGPRKAPKHDIAKSPDDRKNELLFGERYTQSIDYYAGRIDFPP